MQYCTTAYLRIYRTERRGNQQESMQNFENILNIDPNNFDALFNIAVAKAKAGFLEEALICFRKANQRKSNNLLLNATSSQYCEI